MTKLIPRVDEGTKLFDASWALQPGLRIYSGIFQGGAAIMLINILS
jgi:hypothetical protein